MKNGLDYFLYEEYEFDIRYSCKSTSWMSMNARLIIN